MSNIKAIKRENTSSGSNNKLRSQGLIPAILYGGKDANQNISIQIKEIKNLVNSDTFLSKVLELDINGKKQNEHIKATLDENGARIWKKKNNNTVIFKNFFNFF